MCNKPYIDRIIVDGKSILKHQSRRLEVSSACSCNGKKAFGLSFHLIPRSIDDFHLQSCHVIGNPD